MVKPAGAGVPCKQVFRCKESLQKHPNAKPATFRRLRVGRSFLRGLQGYGYQQPKAIGWWGA